MAETNTSNLWYVHINGSNQGPWPQERLQTMFNQGQITAHHLVWSQGMAKWIPLSQSGIIATLSPTAARPRPLSGALPRPLTGQTALGVATGSTHSNTITTQDLESLPTESFGGFWARVVANIADNMFLLVVNIIVAVPLVLMVKDKVLTNLASSLFNLCFTFFYFAVLQSKMRSTFGKKMMGLMVIGDDGRVLTPGECFKRQLFVGLATLPLWAGLIAAGLHSRKQGWHDRWSKTYVIKKSAFEALAQQTPMQATSQQSTQISRAA
jgi:uncharacterized RDD family membrane protein YckC